jgi:ketosteroid isomerase-like protein
MKQYASVITGLMLVVGCTSVGNEETNVNIATKLFDAFNKHEWQTMASYYAEEALFLDPSYGKEYVSKTRTETSAKYAEMESMFPDIHDEVVGVYPSGDVVTVEFVSTGSMNDSVKFKLPIISVLTFKNGQIIKDATYYDLENP